MNIHGKLKLLLIGAALLCATLSPLQATKVAGIIDPNDGLTLNLLPDPAGRPASVVVSNAAGTQFITEANTGIQISSYNTAPTAPQPVGSLPGGGTPSTGLSQVLTFVDGNTGQQATVAINQSSATGQTTIATLQGKVTLNLPGNQQLKIDVGNGAVVDKTGQGSKQTLAQIVQAEKQAGNGQSTMAGFLKQAVEQIAADVTSGALSGDAAVQQLAAIVRVATQADPAQAAAFVSVAVNAITKNTTSSPETAISSVITAATEGNSGLRSTVLNAASTVAQSNGVTYTAANLTSDRGAVNRIFTQTSKTPVNFDVSVVSPSG